MKRLDRSLVLVVGDYPVDKIPFEQRGLTFQNISVEQLDNESLKCSARAVLLTPFPGKFAFINSYFETRFHEACKCGLITAVNVGANAVQVSAIRDAAYKRFKLFRDTTNPEEREHLFSSLPWVYIGKSDWAIAETIARYDPGPPLLSKTPRIVKCDSSQRLDPDTRVLLKRAFYDANRITVCSLSGGRTAKGTYCVFANLDNGQYGPQPMPFFVKIAEGKMIEREKYNYHEFVEPFIPFHLHPSISPKRCVSTLTSSALVGDFVEHSVPLRDSLRTSQGGGAIFSLFEVTLRGLRSHTQKRAKEFGVIEAFLRAKVRANEISRKHPSRIKQLVKNGFTRTPQEIEDALRNCAANIATPQGPYHGDLHYSNVMVRNRDAIVIDFGSMGQFGPLYADPAILEVSLVFGTDDHDDPASFDAWREFVDYVYQEPLLPPLPKGDHPLFAWLHKAIRELRHVGACCGIEEHEALIILAGCLLRYGRNLPLKLRSKRLDKLAENRRAYALVVAYQLCERVEKRYAACR